MAVKLLGVLGVIVFALASTVVGGRLLWVARRTREAPELAMGLAFVVSGAIGFPLLIAGQAALQASGPNATTHLLMALGAGFTFSGYVGLGVGCWRIFRPAARWPLVPIALGTLVLLAVCTLVATSSTPAEAPRRELVTWGGVFVGALTFAWNAAESLLLHAQLRRRRALGLADPAVVNRVLMWSVGTLAALGMTLHGLLLRVLLGPVVADGHRLVSSLFGLVAAVAIWLAFFPPAAYRRRFAASVSALLAALALSGSGCATGYVTYYEPPLKAAAPVPHADPYVRPPPPAGVRLAGGSFSVGCTNLRKFVLLPFPWLRRGFRPDEVQIEVAFAHEPKLAVIDVASVSLTLEGRTLAPFRVAYEGRRPAPVHLETVVLPTRDRYKLTEPQLITFHFKTEPGGADDFRIDLGEITVDGARTRVGPLTFSREGQFVFYRMPKKNKPGGPREEFEPLPEPL
jgi:hypothetical protein